MIAGRARRGAPVLPSATSARADSRSGPAGEKGMAR